MTDYVVPGAKDQKPYTDTARKILYDVTKKSWAVPLPIEDYKPLFENMRQARPDPYTWAQEQDNLADVPYWDKLKPWEQWTHTQLPKIVSDTWNTMVEATPEELRGAIRAVGTPLLAVGAPVLGAIGTLFDIGAEGLERLGGIVTQFSHAKQYGTEDWLLNNLDTAWKASQFGYHAGTVDLSLREDFPNGSLRFEDTASGIMFRAGQMMDQGMTPEEVKDVFEEEYGGLWMRGGMVDLIGHVILDPVNYILPVLKPVERIKSLRIKTWLSKTPEGMQYLDDVVEAGAKSVDEAAQALRTVAAGTDEAADAIKAVDKAAADLARAEATRLEAQGRYFGSLEQKIIDLAGGPEKFLQKTGGIPLGPGAKLSTYSKWKPWTWFQLTPQAQAAELIELVADHVGILVKNADNIDEIAMAIKSISHATLDERYLGHFALSYQGRTVQAATKGADKVIDELVQIWRASAKERGLLGDIGKVIGKSPEDVLALIQKKKYQQIMSYLDEAIRAIPENQLTPLHLNIVAMIRDRTLDQGRLVGLGKMFLGGSTPFNVDTFKTHAMGLLADNAAKQAILQHGVKARGLFTKAANALKAAEALAYLRLNPTYPIRNFMNNELTMAARGVWNRMGKRELESYWERVGVRFSRYDVGYGMAEVEAKHAAKMGVLDIQETIAHASSLLDDAATGKPGIFDKIAYKISKAGDALGPLDTGAWAANIEAGASRRAFTNAWMKAMNKKWKVGDGITHMDEYFIRYFPGMNTNELGPGFVRKIHSALRDAVNEKEIDNILFRNLEANFDDVLESAAQSVGRSTDDIRRVYGDDFIEGLRKDAVDAMERGDIDGLDRVFDNAWTASQDHLDALTRDTVDVLTQRAAARMEAEGPTAYYRLWGESQAEVYGSLEGDLSRIQMRAHEIRAMPSGQQRRAAWDAFFKDNDAHVKRIQARLEAQLEGILQSTERYGTDIADDAIRPFRQMIDDVNGFHAKKKTILNDFYKKKYKSRAARESAWIKTRQSIDAEYSGLINKMYHNSMSLDEQLYKLVKSTQPTDLPFVQAWRKTVADLRRSYMLEVKDHYIKLESAFGATRKQLHDEFAVTRGTWLNRLHLAEREGYQAMEMGASYGSINNLEDFIVDIYAKNLEDVWGPGVLHSQRSFDDMVKLTADRYKIDVSTAEGIEKARRIALREMSENPSRVYSVLEDVWALRLSGDAQGQVQAANAALRDLEIQGLSLDKAADRAMGKIHDPELRLQWERTVRAVHTAETRMGAREVAVRIVKDSNEIATNINVLHAANKGATYNVLYGNMDLMPGYAVGAFEGRAMKLLPGEELTDDIMGDFIRRNADLLSDPRVNIGTWTAEDGTTWLDLSLVMEDKGKAVKLARERGQQSIWDLRNRSGIDIEDRIIDPDYVDPLITLRDTDTLNFKTVKLERYSQNELAVLDPSSSLARTGISGEEQLARLNYGQDYPEYLNYYRAGISPETSVAENATHKYTVEVPEDRLYNLTQDPNGYLEQAKVYPTNLEGERIPGAVGVVDQTQAVIAVQKEGWAGYYYEGVPGSHQAENVRVFDKLKPLETTPWRPGEGYRYLQQRGSYARETIRKELRGVLKDVSDDELDLALSLMEASARMYGDGNTRKIEEWWIDRLGGIEKLPPPSKATEWTAAQVEWINTSRAILSAWEGSDIVNLVHEVGHLLRIDMNPEVSERLLKFIGYQSWSREAEETFAQGFVIWASSGYSPAPELDGVFRQLKNYMQHTVEVLEGEGKRANPFLEKAFRSILGEPQVGRSRANVGSTLLDTMLREEPMIAGPLDELWWKDGGEILNAMRNGAKDQMGKPPLRIADTLNGMDPARRAQWDSALRGYADRLKGDLRDTQHYALNYSNMMRDAALLNYNRRTYFDQAMGMIMPFGFWTTHSAYNWALWSLDRPAAMGTFLKLKRWLETSGNKNMPARFAGSVPIPFGELPFVPDWMGPAYVNPLRWAGWPMQQWMDPVERDYYSGTKIHDRAIRYLQRQLQDGTITQEEYADATSRFAGATWEEAVTEARTTYEGFDPIESLSMIFAPHAPLLWAYHASRGNAEDIQPFLPATRTIKGLTALVGLGPETGVNIEGWLRETIGLPAFDKWEDYRTDRQLSNMVATGEITVQQAMLAMEERNGPTFSEAAERSGKEAGVRTLFGFLGLPFMIYPYGEEESRTLQEGLYKAYELAEQGDDEAVGKYFDEHPEVKARLALFDTPEERLNSFLVDQIWTQWHDLRSLDKRAITDALGDDFELKFLNSETRNPYAVSAETLALWLRLMGGDPPGTLTLPPGTKPIALPPPHISERAQIFYDTRRKLFGDKIWDIQSRYFEIEKGPERKEYLQEFPVLQDYWKWREDWLLRNPNVMPYIVEDEDSRPKYKTFEQQQEAQQEQPSFNIYEYQAYMEPELFRLIQDATISGESMSAVEWDELIDVAEALGVSPEHILTDFENAWNQRPQ